MTALDALPQDRQDAARAAIAEAFGKAELTAAVPILGGASGAAIFRITVGGRRYVLRLDRSADILRDPHRHYACMEAAAQAGVAPALHYADPKACLAIMDFVQQQSLTAFPGGPAALAQTAGTLIGRLQQTPTFARLAPYPAILERMIGYVPTPSEEAQLLVLRYLTRLYYAGLILAIFAGSQSEPEQDLSAPTPDDFRAAAARGEVIAGSPQAMYQLGKTLLAAFLVGENDPCLDRAVQMVSN